MMHRTTPPAPDYCWISLSGLASIHNMTGRYDAPTIIVRVHAPFQAFNGPEACSA